MRFKLYHKGILLFILLFLSCKKDSKNTVQILCDIDATPYKLNLPSYFPQVPTYNQVQLTQAKVSLGKKLYYEPRISSFNQSCSSCHIQSQSFTSPMVNSLPHLNLIFNQNFLWAGGVQTGMLDAMHYEVNSFFGTNPNNINNSEYKPLFCKAFGSDEVTNNRIAECLMQFISTLVTGNSKFDKYLRGETMLSPSEFNGFNIFSTEKGDCFHCHGMPLFTDNSFRNIGLDSIFTAANWGLYENTHKNSDMGKYKVPTLINIALTAPYMHDGRYNTLDDVINFYDHGMKYSVTLDPLMMKNNKLQNGLQLSAQDKADLKAFLLSLTDSTFINNPAYR